MMIEITDIEDVQDGDIVTLRWEEEPGISVTLEGPAQDSVVGDYTITSARFVSATREVPDDAETLRAEVQRLEAEVERWKAEAEMLTAKVDRLMPLQEHENECAYRQRAEKAEAEVERLRAACTVPTREQFAAAIWPLAPESARSQLAETDLVDRVMDAILIARGRAHD